MKTLRKALGVLIAASLLGAVFCPVPAKARHSCCAANASHSGTRGAKSSCAVNCASPAADRQAVPAPTRVDQAALLPTVAAAGVPPPAPARLLLSPSLLYRSPPVARTRDRSPPAC